jgi:hypothetical protein
MSRPTTSNIPDVFLWFAQAPALSLEFVLRNILLRDCASRCNGRRGSIATRFNYLEPAASATDFSKTRSNSTEHFAL